MKALFAIFLFSLSSSAFAGAESHGGGAVFCAGKEPVILDYYQATIPTLGGGAPDLVDASSLSEEEMSQWLFEGIKFTNLMYPWMRASNLLGSPNTWLAQNLTPVPDADPAYLLPAGCELKQAAIRQGTTVYVDPSIYNALSPAQKAILEFHEQLFYLAEQAGKKTSVEVRMVIRNLLLKKRDELALASAVRKMGYSFYWWEKFTGHNYIASDSVDPGNPSSSVNWLYPNEKSPTSLLTGILGPLTIQCDDGRVGSSHVTCKSVTLGLDDPNKCILSNFGVTEKSPSFTLNCSGWKKPLIFQAVD